MIHYNGRCPGNIHELSYAPASRDVETDDTSGLFPLALGKIIQTLFVPPNNHINGPFTGTFGIVWIKRKMQDDKIKSLKL